MLCVVVYVAVCRRVGVGVWVCVCVCVCVRACVCACMRDGYIHILKSIQSKKNSFVCILINVIDCVNQRHPPSPVQIAALHQRMQDITHAAYLCGTNVICYQEAWSKYNHETQPPCIHFNNVGTRNVHWNLPVKDMVGRGPTKCFACSSNRF